MVVERARDSFELFRIRVAEKAHAARSNPVLEQHVQDDVAMSCATARRFQTLLENSSDIVSIHDTGGVLRYATPAFERILGHRLRDSIGLNMFDLIHPDDLPVTYEAFARVVKRSNLHVPTEFRIRHATGIWIPVESVGNNLLDDPMVGGIVVTTRNISDRRHAELRYQTLVEQLPAITYIMALGETNRTTFISPQVESLLGFSPDEWIADPDLWIRQLHPDDRDRVVQHMRQQGAHHTPVDLEYRLISRDGRAFWFRNRSVTIGDGDGELGYAHGILFDITQRKQYEHELSDAYDSTLEGWSRALDLRDNETEGHTQRVVDLTLRLARAMGISDAELVHVRRGAILHDIGKLGVPDCVLLKPGPLTADEWIAMRRHPVYAYELLSPIAFLRPALDIPYCHHEKWDGTGYPRGLRGEQIPLVARIFAIVDVWDGLGNARPYHKGRSEEEAIEYIRSEAGTHFDPHIVQAFLKLIIQE